MKNWKNLKHIFIAWGILLFIVFAIFRIFGSDFLLPITHFFVYREAPFQDFIYKYHWTPSKDIVIIKIGQKTLNEVQSMQNDSNLTLKKEIYADVVKNLEGVRVKAIGFDIIFQNRDDTEKTFVDVLDTYKNIFIGTSSSVGDCTSDSNGGASGCDGIPRSIYNIKNWGLVELSDSYDRRNVAATIKNPYNSSTPQEILTLPLALYLSAHSGNTLPSSLTFPQSLNPFFGGENTYKTVEFSDLLKESKADLFKEFNEKYVLIGTEGSLFQDLHKSPVTGTLIDGVDFHAHFLDGLLQNRIPKEVDPVLFYTIISIIALLAVIAYLFLPNITSPLLAIFLTFFVIWISRYFYFHFAIVIDIFPLFCVTGFLAFPVTFIYRFFVIDGEKRKLTSAFSHYIDPTLVKQIADNAKDIYLGGESRELTVLFSDIAGFTTISEKLDPKDLFSLMSSYLSRMTDILIKNGGTLDKYIGDAVMGFFGAPISEADHALRSCRTALAMRATLPEFNSEIISHGLAPIDFRIGIASGEVLVGNIGSHDRFNYTVLGDTVNLASRLEATSKEYGTHIILAEPTYLLVKDEFFCRKLDCIAVKGKTLGVGIYELIADIRDVSFDRKKYEIYGEALILYFEEKYLEAGKLWESNMSDDIPSEIMAKRCLEILKGNVTVEGGVYRMTHK